ncbi:MAG: hypothetical protein JO206_02625 [Solirubrobacterales bacterium]|nr:hypothetical protein [Solirubrobacterales bacterium]
MRAGAPRLALVQRALQFLGALPESGLLDRLIRGRAWIPILGVMLAGIVAMQVEVLKLGTTIGRSIERGAVLQSRNDVLRQSVSLLADDQRIERLATGMGMVMPAPEAISFLPVHGIDAGQVLAAIQAPDATAFTAHLPAAASPGSAGGALGAPGVGSGAGTTATAGAGTAAAASATTGSGTATASGSGSTSAGAGPGAGSGSGAGGGAGNGAGAGGSTGSGAGSSPGPGTGTAAASTGAGSGTSGSAGTTAASGLTSSQSQSGGAAPSGQ